MVDVAAAVAVLAACGVAAQEVGPPAGWRWVPIVAVAAPVAVRRRWPVPAALTALAAAGVLLRSGIVPSYAAPGPIAAVALTLYVVTAVPVLIAGLAGAALLGPLWPTVVAVPWLTGWLVRHRRHLAEQLAEQRSARAVTEERLRIARDVHDTVAHSLSMITMKASVARHVAATRPEESAAALEVIETAGREALLQMRRTLGLLRDEPADLHALGDRDGVTMSVAGEASLPPGVRAVVYRIVQESLTNVTRHAPGAACTVDVDAGPRAVTVRVADDGGFGLRGMRERVTAYGGTLAAGPQPDGGFAVTAHIPYDDETP
ncbi:histidine kinase [Actinoplanes sp. SE50]|nr:histidine kinase [Actinoplanes sp. SE50/110]ATO83526.1 histidine kinase [Actinoplanes sp. SE50]SLM00933.1 two-component sensor histidine kinase [Actinoplanes sp. SE50/110]